MRKSGWTGRPCAGRSRLCLAAGVDGIVVLGLATEVAKLTEAERREVIGWAAQDVAGRVPLGVTIYGNSITEQLALLQRAPKPLGADWLILQPPSVGAYPASELAAPVRPARRRRCRGRSRSRTRRR